MKKLILILCFVFLAIGIVSAENYIIQKQLPNGSVNVIAVNATVFNNLSNQGLLDGCAVYVTDLTMQEIVANGILGVQTVEEFQLIIDYDDDFDHIEGDDDDTIILDHDDEIHKVE